MIEKRGLGLVQLLQARQTILIFLGGVRGV